MSDASGIDTADRSVMQRYQVQPRNRGRVHGPVAWLFLDVQWCSSLPVWSARITRYFQVTVGRCVGADAYLDHCARVQPMPWVGAAVKIIFLTSGFDNRE